MRTIDDATQAATGWRAGFGYEFLERPDGFPGLSKRYGLRFKEPPKVMDLTLTYRALAAGQVDLIAGDATAGLIDALDLFPLADNRGYFPPYDAVPVARTIRCSAIRQCAGRWNNSEGRSARPTCGR